MRKKKVGAIAIKSFALPVVLGTVSLGTAKQAMAQDAKTPYLNMAPIDQYLMKDQRAEIALARSAAPESISRDAEVLVLGRHGFETAVKGKNGFVCIVGRRGHPLPMPTFGIRRCGFRCVLTRQPRVLTLCASPRSPNWLWRDTR